MLILGCARWLTTYRYVLTTPLGPCSKPRRSWSTIQGTHPGSRGYPGKDDRSLEVLVRTCKPEPKPNIDPVEFCELRYDLQLFKFNPDLPNGIIGITMISLGSQDVQRIGQVSGVVRDYIRWTW
jgi:hypothetical protein